MWSFQSAYCNICGQGDHQSVDCQWGNPMNYSPSYEASPSNFHPYTLTYDHYSPPYEAYSSNFHLYAGYDQGWDPGFQQQLLQKEETTRMEEMMVQIMNKWDDQEKKQENRMREQIASTKNLENIMSQFVEKMKAKQQGGCLNDIDEVQEEVPMIDDDSFDQEEEDEVPLNPLELRKELEWSQSLTFSNEQFKVEPELEDKCKGNDEGDDHSSSPIPQNFPMLNTYALSAEDDDIAHKSEFLQEASINKEPLEISEPLELSLLSRNQEDEENKAIRDFWISLGAHELISAPLLAEKEETQTLLETSIEELPKLKLQEHQLHLKDAFFGENSDMPMKNSVFSSSFEEQKIEEKEENKEIPFVLHVAVPKLKTLNEEPQDFSPYFTYTFMGTNRSLSNFMFLVVIGCEVGKTSRILRRHKKALVLKLLTQIGRRVLQDH